MLLSITVIVLRSSLNNFGAKFTILTHAQKSILKHSVTSSSLATWTNTYDMMLEHLKDAELFDVTRINTQRKALVLQRDDVSHNDDPDTSYNGSNANSSCGNDKFKRKFNSFCKRTGHPRCLQ